MVCIAVHGAEALTLSIAVLDEAVCRERRAAREVFMMHSYNYNCNKDFEDELLCITDVMARLSNPDLHSLPTRPTIRAH